MNSTGKLVALVDDHKIEVREYPLPDVADDAILLATGLTGICGTDIHNIGMPISPERRASLPSALGHEVAGRIIKMGAIANDSVISDTPLQVGDRVVGLPAVGCGECWWCRKFGTLHGNICEAPRARRPVDKPPHFVGGWGDYVYVPPGQYLWKIPEDMPYEVAVLTEPFSIGIRGVEKAMSLPAWKNEQTLGFGGTVTVLGAGAIGVLTAAAARIAGAGKIILVGAPTTALNVAQEIGVADLVVNVLETSGAERIQKVRDATPGGYGADVVFEAAGAGEAFVEGLEMLRRLGTFVEMGYFVDTGKTVNVNVARLITRKDLALYSSYSQPPQYFGKAIATLIRTWRTIPFQKLVTAIFPLEQAQAAVDLVFNPNEKGIKVAFTGADYREGG